MHVVKLMESENGPAKMLNRNGEMLQMCIMSVIELVYDSENAQTILHIQRIHIGSLCIEANMYI